MARVGIGNVIGQRFNRLTIIEQYGEGRTSKCLCKCDCGGEKITTYSNLSTNNTMSCGCLHREMLIERNKKTGKWNGASGNEDTKSLYSVWSAMRIRCTNESSWAYKWYGAKGVKVCEDWSEDFSNFSDWAFDNGYAIGLTIDRVDSNGNYEPSNCRWVTMKIQANNKSNNKLLEYKGEVKTLAQWCEELKLNYDKTKSRLNAGRWSVEEAFEKPSGWNKYSYGEGVSKRGRNIVITYDDKTLTLKEWIKELELDCDYERLSGRARRGWSGEDILMKPSNRKS